MDVNLEVIIDIDRHRQEIVLRDETEAPVICRVLKRCRLDSDGNRVASRQVNGKCPKVLNM